MNSLSLSKRGLLLVAVPLVFQAVIVVALAALLLNMHAQILKEQRSRDLESGLFSAILNSADDFMLPSASYISDTHGNAKESAQKVVLMASRFESLMEIADQEPGNQDTVKNIRLYSQAFATACSEGVVRRGHWGSYREQIQSSALLLLQDVKKLIDVEEKRRRESPVSSRALRGQVAILLVAAVLFSVIFAILTAYGYAAGIRGPLERIRRNSRLLAQRSELLPLSHDCPEIDALDQRLHEVAQSANAALAHERAMIDNARDLICSLDQSGGFSAANAYARTMLGINPEQLIGQHLTDLAVAEDAGRADQYVQNAFKTPEISKFELRLQAGKRQLCMPVYPVFVRKMRKHCSALSTTLLKSETRIGFARSLSIWCMTICVSRSMRCSPL